MKRTVDQDDYSELCEKHDFFKILGYDGFETKIWLLFKHLLMEQLV